MKVIVYLAVLVLVAVIAVSECKKKSKKFKEHHHCFEPSGNDTSGEDYQKYLKCHHKNYNSSNDPHAAQRKQNYEKCVKDVLAHDPDAAGYARAVSKFCHWTAAEFNGSLNFQAGNIDVSAVAVNVSEIPSRLRAVDYTSYTNFSWVDQGAVASVKDQGHCGNCYTFAATGAMEGQYQLKYGSIVDLSPQQYTDCAYNWTTGTSTSWSSSTYTSCYGTNCTTTVKNTTSTKQTYTQTYPSVNQGCNGGNYFASWGYNAGSSQGLNLWSCYPLVSNKTLTNGQCAWSSSCSVKVGVKNWTALVSDEKSLLVAVGTIGPMACAIDASNLSGYAGGVFTGPANVTNHAILVVGWGNTTYGTPYWVIKNSWGATWGQNGFFWLQRGVNALNISSSCGYPNIL